MATLVREGGNRLSPWLGYGLIPALVLLLAAFSRQQVPPGPLLGTPTPTPSATPTPTPTPTPSPTPTHTPTPTATPTATPTPTPTPAAGSEASFSPQPTAEEHYWLSRPIAPPGNPEASRYYPYGTTAQGQYLLHHGVDLVNEMGTPVLAVADGRVVAAGDDHQVAYGPTTDFYGQVVILELDRRWQGRPIYCLYGHLSEVEVRVGDWVARGDVVGKVGMSGIALGPHLHLEVRVGENSYGATRNPELWLRPLPGMGTIAGRLVDAAGRMVPETLVTLHPASAPDKRLWETWTYPEGEVNPDDVWPENFLFADVPEGEYVLKTQVGGQWFFPVVRVEAGRTARVEVRAR
ncbi:MAG: peptidoglycan DD-metalloendopeptidase family protein [Anaerolineae bacterium]